MKKIAFFVVFCTVLVMSAPIEARKAFTYANGEKIEYFIDETGSTFEILMDEKVEEEVYSGKSKLTDALFASFASAAQTSRFELLPSFEMAGAVAKASDDRIYATIELALEDEKIGLLKGLVPNLQGDALTFICVALHLSGVKDACPVAIQTASQAGQFLKDPYNSKPIGFYTWNINLGTIFTRDRWLQRAFDTGEKNDLKIALDLAKAISGSPTLKKSYSSILNIYAKLTNPSTNYYSALDNITGKKPFAFFPPSRSKETDLINKFVAKGGIAAGRTMDLLISAIKNGEVSLKPAANSGWYDYQQFSMEPFLLPEKMPEGKKLFFNAVYKKRLENSFRSSVTQARETHVKQLERPGETGAEAPEFLEVELYISPKFSIEPMPTFYSRTAQAYIFLIKALDEPILNNEVLELVEENTKLDAKEEKAIKEGYYQLNKPPVNIRSRLRELLPLFNQFSERSALDIGLNPSGIKTQAVDDFLSGWKNWPEMKQDIRVIVPIGPLDARDPSKGINYWAILGIEPLEIKVSYNAKPKIEIPRKNVKAKIEYGTSYYTILVPVFAEVVIPGASPPTREEFRKVCDKYKTKDAILAALRKGVI